MEFWQVAVTCAAILYVSDYLTNIVMTSRQKQLDKKLITIETQIETIREEMRPMVDLWWKDEDGKQPAISYFEREFSDEPKPMRDLMITQSVGEIRMAVTHYAFDLREQPLREAAEALLLEAARTPSERRKVQLMIKDRVAHMRDHESELLQAGYKPDELMRRFGPSR